MGLWVLTHLRVAEGRLAEARTSAAELETVVLDLGRLNWWASVTDTVARGRHCGRRQPRPRSGCARRQFSTRPARPELLACYYATKGEALASIGDLGGARKDLAVVVDATASDRAPSDRVRALVTLAHIERREGRADDAEDHAHEVLRLGRPMGHKRGVVDALEVLGMCAVDAQSFGEAARLLGAADALRRATGYQYRSPLAQGPLAESVVALDAALSAEERDRAWAEGEALSLEDACDYAARGRGKRKRPATGWAALTATEAQVAALAAEGQTNAQVGEQLFMSRHTVDSHLRHIYAKLGVSTRAELATRVARQDGADV